MTGLPVTMPRRWLRVRGGYAAPGVHASGVAPRLECRSVPFEGDLEAWRRRVAAADQTRPGFDLEDEDVFDLAGRDVVYRRFGHRAAGVPVLCEQWLWVVGGLAHQLLGTVAREDYADYCDVFEDVAETFDPDPTAWSA
jgi:hypothetical protein